VRIGAHIERIGDICDERFDPAHVTAADFGALELSPLPSLIRPRERPCSKK
jgi:hypothetical protein